MHAIRSTKSSTKQCVVNHVALVAFRAFLCSLAWPKLQSNRGTPIWNEVFTQCHETKMSLTRKSKMVVELLGGWNMREPHCFRGKKQNLINRLLSS